VRTAKVVKREPDLLDVGVGQRVQACRLQKGLSQQKLADQLGVTCRQVQKYEKGADHIGAARLQVIAGILGVPVYDFFTWPGWRAARPKGFLKC
jgi:transcriptional regulator with XRE-family HTH domain